jgi:hypothetical protein
MEAFSVLPMDKHYTMEKSYEKEMWHDIGKKRHSRRRWVAKSTMPKMQIIFCMFH